MNSAEVIQKVREVPNRKALSRESGVSYDYLCRLAQGRIKDPGASKVDKLRAYFLKHS